MAGIIISGLSVVISRDFERMRTDLLHDAHAYTSFLNQNFIKIFDTGSIDEAAELSLRLQNFPNIEGMILYNINQIPIYEYHQPGIERLTPLPGQTKYLQRFSDKALTVIENVEYADILFGRVHLQLATTRLDNARKSVIEQMLILVVAAVIASLLLIFLIQHYFSLPILKLASVLRRTGKNDNESNNHSLQLPIKHKDEIGDLYRGFNVMQDKISQTHNKLELSIERREMALSVANEGIFDWCLQNDTVTFDKRFFTLSGYEIDAFPHEIEEWKKRVHPEYSDYVLNTLEQYLSGELSVFDVEFKYQCKDATYMWVHCKGKITVKDSNGQPLRFIGTHSDINKQKAAEQALLNSEHKYRTLFEKTADAILIIESGEFVDCNTATVELLGYQNKQELLKVHPSQLSPEFQPDGRKSFEKANEMMAIATEQGSHRFEWDHLHANGDIIPIEVLLTSVTIDKKHFIHVVWRNITERKQTEKALRHTQKLDAIGQLTGGIAHDFNNILGVILGNLSLIDHQLGNEIDEKVRKRFETIEHSTQRAANLTKQLLGFSRSDAGSIEVTNINNTIEKMQNLLSQALTPQIEVQYQLADNLWQTEIDAGDFEDTLLNLVLNARDAMNGKGKLGIETRNIYLDVEFCSLTPDTSVGDYIELSISDNGEGIDTDVQDKIFDPFFTTKEQGKGTGLGLAMVFGFVKRSNGVIKLYSEHGSGTTFRIYLPRAIDEQQSSSLNVKQIESIPKGKDTLLIVDDEKALLDVTKDYLQPLGYTILTAETGDVALQVLSQHNNISLVISDVMMPGMSGYELAEKVNQLYPHMKILLSSGYTEKPATQNDQAGFNDNLLSKPYSLSILAQRIRDQLDN